jgi:ribosomal protein S18 acetylase RimI-like enzyme
VTPGAAVRLARLEDAAALARLRYQFRTELEPAGEAGPEFIARCTEWMRARLGGAGAWRAWVAERGGVECGMVWLQLVEKIPNPVAEAEWHGYVTSLYVRPEWRAAGLGSALLQAALEECTRREVDAVFLWPTPRSRSLYERYGFRAREEVMVRRGREP